MKEKILLFSKHNEIKDSETKTEGEKHKLDIEYGILKTENGILNTRYGLTLVELIVGIVILTILASIGFISYMGYSSQARDTVRIQDLKNVEEQLLYLKAVNKEFPNPDNFVLSEEDENGIKWKIGTMGERAIKELRGLTKIPIDPITGSGYLYMISESGLSYKLEANLENLLKNNPNEENPKIFSLGNYKQAVIKNCKFGNFTIKDGETEIFYNGQELVNSESECIKSNKITLTCNTRKLTSDSSIEINTELAQTYKYKTCVKGLAENCKANTNFTGITNTLTQIYTLGVLNHSQTGRLETDITENHGTFTYSTEVTCNDGDISNTEEIKTLKSCNTNYHANPTNDTCINNTQTCPITNGTGTQIWNGTTWGTCTVQTCNPGYININGVCEKVGTMELVYNGLVSGDVVDLPFRGIVNLQSVDCGTGGTWDGIKNGYTKCTYGAGVNSGDTIIKVDGKATGFGEWGYYRKGITKLTKVNSWKDMGFIDLENAFQNAINLVYVPNDDGTKNVTNMDSMFSWASKFNGNINLWDTSKVTNMNGMFSRASKFNKSISNFDTSNVTSMTAMFYGASSFNQSVSNFNTSNVTSMIQMFCGTTNFNQSVANFNTSNVTRMGEMFCGASSFNQNLDNFDTSNVTDMFHMFIGASSFNNGDTTGVLNKPLKFNTSKVTDMRSMFYGATSFNQNLDNFDTSNVTEIYDMFYGATSFNNGDIAGRSNKPLKFDTSKVTNMYRMFGGASSFNQSLTSFNTSNVLGMFRMFSGASSFNQPLTSFNTSNVVNMREMFSGASNFNQPLSSFNTSKVTDMSYMFNKASNFNQNLDNFDTSNVTNMGQMFAGASSFNQPLTNFNTSNVTNMGGMFNGASNFNQPLSNWDTSNVITMTYSYSYYYYNNKNKHIGMFEGATSFNQNLNCWNVTKVTDYIDFNKDSGLEDINLPKWGTAGTGTCQ